MRKRLAKKIAKSTNGVLPSRYPDALRHAARANLRGTERFWTPSPEAQNRSDRKELRRFLIRLERTHAATYDKPYLLGRRVVRGDGHL